MSAEALSRIPLADLLAHRPPMVLLDKVVAHDPGQTTCVTTIRDNALFREPDGLVPAWVGLEYMAQCIAVHAGLRARASGERPPVGFLIGSRHVDFHIAGFDLGQVLLVTARHLWGETGLGSFACRVQDASTTIVAAEGTLKVFVPDDLDAFMARRAE